ncbi:sodium-dependent transporter [bacterium]|nr:sodium-dependent transporter [candidate division CSSED10-310 bacterium]
MEQRKLWDNRTGFILAAIGSAIGLGNVWRFPYICYKYGGGAFLIPYLIALFTTGIPLMILEFSLGHRMAGGAPSALGRIRKNWEWLGWLALLVAFVITIYYAVIMGWCLDYIGFSTNLAWGDNPGDFFLKDFLAVAPDHFTMGSVRPWIAAGLFLSWIAIIGAIWRGTKTVGKVVYITVFLPWLLLLVFLLRGITLPGAFAGLNYFLKPNFAALADLEVWAAAFTQVFFSLSLGFGVMIAYASFLPRKSDIVNNAFIISLLDAATAFVGGLVVFSTLGYYAHTTGQPVESVVKAGPSLVFITYPTIISLLPFMPRFLGILFFLMLFMLGIDSAFSLVESVVTGIIDKFNTPRTPTLLAVGTVGFLLGLFFCTKAGLLWLDVTDHFMNQFGLMTVCLLEAVLIGWIVTAEPLRKHVNLFSEIRIGKWWDFLLKFFIPIVLSVLLLNWLNQRITASYEGYKRSAEFLGGWLLVFLLPVVSVFLMGARKIGWMLTGLFGVTLAISLVSYRQGVDFSGIVIASITFIILFGGAGLCIIRGNITDDDFTENPAGDGNGEVVVPEEDSGLPG